MTSALGPLRPGDRVALLGTAGPPPRERLERALALVRSWKLEPVAYASALAEHLRADYLSGPDSLRARDLQQAWCDPEIAAIFVVRGGYGTTRMLDLLDEQAMARARPKPVYGSSDVTALHEWLDERLGVPSWFAPMIATADLLDDEVAIAGLQTAVCGPWPEAYAPAGAEALAPGRARGRLIGGNLNLLALTLGARSRPRLDHANTIAILEDVNEETYKLDGYVTALLRAGWFEGVRGIVLGSWKGCEPAQVRDLCAELLTPLGLPIAWQMRLGHCAGAASVPLGVACDLIVDDRPRLHWRSNSR